jgi:hypothetical protein
VKRAAVALAALAGAVLAVAGCRTETTELPPSQPARVQQAELGWVEREPAAGPGLVFAVHRFQITADGWAAEIELENRTAIEWEVSSDRLAAARSFGVMLFATGALDELVSRNRDGDLPGLREAIEIEPALPYRLEPDDTWRGTISAPGTLAAGRYVRVVFGPLLAIGDPPSDLRADTVWITDHAYRLRG